MSFFSQQKFSSMLDINRILIKKRHNRQFKATFGVDVVEFNALFVVFNQQMIQYEAQKAAARLANPYRKNKPGGGAKSAFADYEIRLGFLLYYLKQYPTFDALGMVYAISGNYANRLFHAWYPLLFRTLQELNVMPKSDFQTAEEFQAFLQQYDVETILADVTERLIQRPTHNQKQYYSGKKKDTL